MTFVLSEIDKSADKGVWLAPCAEVAGKRVIYSGTGALDQDIDDVRCFGEAMEKGVKKALAAGCRSPLLVSSLASAKFFLNFENLNQIYLPHLTA